MEYYITKYALTRGIYKVDGEESDKGNISVDGYMGLYFTGEYYETEKEAITDARDRRDKKIESLEKQLEKMKGNKFVLLSLTD